MFHMKVIAKPQVGDTFLYHRVTRILLPTLGGGPKSKHIRLGKTQEVCPLAQACGAHLAGGGLRLSLTVELLTPYPNLAGFDLVR